jgi:hypothetical protein
VLGAEKASKNSGRRGKIDHRGQWNRLAWVIVLKTSIDQGFLRNSANRALITSRSASNAPTVSRLTAG